MQTNKNLKVGLVGCGYIARQVHIPLWKRAKDAKLVAVCDVDKALASKTAEQFGILKSYSDLQEMLSSERLDLLDICVPPQAHASVMMQALNAGINCMVEKPFTATVDEADKVMELAEKKGLKLFVIHNHSFVPAARWLRNIVNQGKLGDITLLETHYFAPLSAERYADPKHWIHSLPGGILNSEILPHLLMLVLEYMDDVTEAQISVAKASKASYIKADELNIILTSSTGTVARVGLSFNSTVPVHSMTVTGSKGAAFLDFFTQATVFHRLPRFGQTDELTLDKYTRGKWAISDIWQRCVNFIRVSYSVLSNKYAMRTEGHRYLMDLAIQDLLNHGSYPVDISKGREVVRLVELIGKTKLYPMDA
ncbi:MAG: Gfo/Idh/MocA family oxidoreductase [Conexivisphaerales archaeon]